MRQMLLDGVPGESWQYGCIVTLLNGNNSFSTIFTQPLTLKINGYLCCEFVLAGARFLLLIAEHEPKMGDFEFSLNRQGEWVFSHGRYKDYPRIYEKLLDAYEHRKNEP